MLTHVHLEWVSLQGTTEKPQIPFLLAQPVMTFWGEGDEILPQQVRDFFRTHLPPHTHWLEPAGYGHAPYLDSTRGFIEAVQEWLDEAARAA